MVLTYDNVYRLVGYHFNYKQKFDNVQNQELKKLWL